MKIGKNLLKNVTNDDLETEELYSESTYQHIAMIYNNTIMLHTKKHAGFLTPQVPEDKRKRQVDQIQKFIDMCIEFELSFDVVINEQIKILTKFYKERGLKLFPSFATLVSDNARKRMGYIKNAIKRRYTGSARAQELFRVQFLDIEKSLRDSMRKVYIRFKQTKELKIELKEPIGTIQKFKAVQELEIMARAKLVSNIYIYSSPLSEETEFLKEVKKEADHRLSDQQKEAIVKIKEDLISEFKDKEVLKYV